MQKQSSRLIWLCLSVLAATMSMFVANVQSKASDYSLHIFKPMLIEE